MFALVDCNSFYASCERLFRPDLRERPIVVLSNNDGCIIALCDRAKALGIKMGEPHFKVKGKLEELNVAVFSSNYTLYGDISNRVSQVLERFAPKMEIYSIDEAFLDLSGMKHFDLEDYANQIRTEVLKCVGIPTCVGIAPTKALAKAANRVAKKFKDKTQGVWILDSPEKVDKCLAWLDIEDVWGIGRRYAERFKAMEVLKAKDFIALPEAMVKSMMTIVGLRLQKELKGESCLPLESMQKDKQSICTSRSFGKMLEQIEDVKSAVALYASRCARKLRAGKLCARTMVVFIHTNPFNPNDPQRSIHSKHTFPVPTNFDLEIVSTALAMLEKIWVDGYRYKKAGVIVLDNVPEYEVQGNLFDEVDRNKARKFMLAMDQVNKRYGDTLARLGCVQTHGDWKLRRNLLSPCYTTQWDQIPVFRI